MIIIDVYYIHNDLRKDCNETVIRTMQLPRSSWLCPQPSKGPKQKALIRKLLI